MKAEQSQQDNAKTAEVKEIHPTCSNSRTIAWLDECGKVDWNKYFETRVKEIIALDGKLYIIK